MSEYKMSEYIIVKPVWKNDVTGIISYFYDEFGTPAFYMIRDILRKHFGEDIWISINRKNFYEFYVFDFDKTKNINDIIKNIYEPHTLVIIFEEHMPSAHITFEFIGRGVE
jgi:hypothetical protein